MQGRCSQSDGQARVHMGDLIDVYQNLVFQMPNTKGQPVGLFCKEEVDTHDTRQIGLPHSSNGRLLYYATHVS